MKCDKDRKPFSYIFKYLCSRKCAGTTDIEINIFHGYNGGNTIQESSVKESRGKP